MSNVLHGDEISSALGSPIITELQQDAQDATNLATSITDFVAASNGMLAGPGWEKVNAKMTEFGDVLNERMKLATAFGEAIQDALKLCLDFLAEDPAVDSLDAADLDEITTTRDAAQADRDFIAAHMNDTKTCYGTRKNADGEDEQYSWEEPMYNVDDCKAKLAELDKDIEYANKLIAKIAKMDTVYNEAMTMLEEAYSKVSEFGTKVGTIVPSGRFKFDNTMPFTPSVPAETEGGKETTTPGQGSGNTRTVVSTEVRETGSKYVEYSDGTSAVYRADGTLDQSWDADGNMTMHDAEGRPTTTQHKGGGYTTYYPDGSVHKVVENGQETEYMQGQYGNGATVASTEVRETGSRYVEYSDGTSAVYRADGTLDQSWDASGNMTMHDTEGRPTTTQRRGGGYTTYYPDGSVHKVVENGQETEYMQGQYGNGAKVTSTEVRETGSRYVEYSDGTSAVYRADGTLDQSWDKSGSMTTYDTEGRPTATQHQGGGTTTYYPDGSVKSARDISGTEYTFTQGENVRTVAPVSATPLEYNENGNMPPNTTFDEDGYVVIRDDHGVIMSRIQPEYTPVEGGTDISYSDPSNGNQIIIHSPYGGTNS